MRILEAQQVALIAIKEAGNLIRIKIIGKNAMSKLKNINEQSLNESSSGHTTTIFEQEGESIQTSKNLGESTKSSKKRWRKPTNVKEFISQANALATLFLNGEVDVETVRQYSAVSRTIAQSLTNETARARFLKMQPDMTFSEDVFEDD